MRRRDMLGLVLALFISVVLMIRVFLEWEDTLSLLKLSAVILGAFLSMVGISRTSRALGMTGLAITTLVTPFIFWLDDVTDAAEILIFILLVGLPIIVLLELISAMKAGKTDVSVFQVLWKKEMELQRYHFLPITVCLAIVMMVMILMSVILSINLSGRVLTSRGYLLWTILILTGLALMFTVPFIGPFTTKIKK
jgi:hypothetical protein